MRPDWEISVVNGSVISSNRSSSPALDQSDKLLQIVGKIKDGGSKQKILSKIIKTKYLQNVFVKEPTMTLTASRKSRGFAMEWRKSLKKFVERKKSTLPKGYMVEHVYVQ